jgi:amino acid adenylation domain-containing protein
MTGGIPTADLLTDLLRGPAVATPGKPVMGELTYAGLDRRSNRLARFLTGRGVGPGVPVGLHLDKGPEALVAMFGILKAGGCYVPIDPTGPASRAATIVREAGLELLLVDAATAGMVEGVTALTVEQAVSGCDDAPVETVPARGEDPAYVLFTSGSTGVPKGVTLSHRAALAFVRHCVTAFGLTGEDRFSSHAPLHFDLAVLDVFGAVAVGATIVPITGTARVFPTSLASVIAAERITVWYSVPFALSQLAQRGWTDDVEGPGPRVVLFAGEPMPVEDLRLLMRCWPDARWFNLYGPTETNVVTLHQVTAEESATVASLPIGRPWPDTEAIVVGSGGRVLGEGQPGELWVRGPTQMTGYWNDPEKTQGAFADQPDQHGRRFYRTGDHVVRDGDGVLWFHGRADHMVKIRGHRVELGEIESILRRLPALAEAAVFARPGADGDTQLVAVVSAVDPADPPSTPDLLSHCRAHLPRYMVPEEIRWQDALPRTSTGKLDRQAVEADLSPVPQTPTGATR